MISVRTTNNYDTTALKQSTMGQTIGVRLKDRDYRKVRWSGFLSREHAADLEGARSVKLQVTNYTLNHNMAPERIKVGKDKFLQGCLVQTNGMVAPSLKRHQCARVANESSHQ